MSKALSPDKISVVALILLITGAIDSIRNLPGTALFGSSLIFFSLFSAIVFLIPVALVAAELSSTWHEAEGGIYSWTKTAFGETAAFFTIWLQWINTMVWYPSVLSFIAGTLAYMLNPELAHQKIYLVSVILIVFWSLTLLGLGGLKTSARFAGFCAVVGMLIPMAFIIVLAIIWMFQGKPLAINLSLSSLVPNLYQTDSWVSLTAIMTSFLGMELAAVHVRNVEHPRKNFPIAMLCSVLLILITMIMGSLAIAIVLPAKDMNLVEGVMLAFRNFLDAWHMQMLMPVLVVMLLLGSVGGMVNWIISPAKGLLLAANHGYLPHWLYRLNKHGVASRILILQAVLVTIFSSLFMLMPSINEIYWLFTDLSTELYIMMYVMMFFAAIKLKSTHGEKHRPFSIPGGKMGYYLTCVLGLLGCVVTLIIGFFPPEQSLGMGSSAHFRMIFSAGIVLMLLPAVLLYGRKRLTEKQ